MELKVATFVGSAQMTVIGRAGRFLPPTERSQRSFDVDSPGNSADLTRVTLLAANVAASSTQKRETRHRAENHFARLQLSSRGDCQSRGGNRENSARRHRSRENLS